MSESEVIAGAIVGAVAGLAALALLTWIGVSAARAAKRLAAIEDLARRNLDANLTRAKRS